MRPSLLVVAVAAFVGAIAIFSRAYNLLLRFFEAPSLLGLVTLFVLVAVLVLALGVLGFVMYVTDRRQGNVKVKIALFERLLGHPPDAPLDARAVPAALRPTRKEKQ